VWLALTLEITLPSHAQGVGIAEGSIEANPRRTVVSIDRMRWLINGQVTYPGSPAEGLLMNVRMVNSTFEDLNREDFDPETNTDRFLKRLPDYVAHGIRAITLNLQGGHAGYEGARNSAFDVDGALRDRPLARIKRVIEACDSRGVVVIVGCFYQRQDQILRDERAVKTALINAVSWIKEEKFTNVVLEVANEFPHKGFDHPILRKPEGEVELIHLAKRACPDLLVSTSGIGDGRYPETVAQTADFVLIHFNGVPVEEIPERIAALKRFGKPIVCNEDDKTGVVAARAAELCVKNGASWGLMLKEINQYWPFEFHGASDDPIVYAKIKELTTPQ